MPLFSLVVLIGLSMDYHVFVLSRVREGLRKGLDYDRAVELGIRDTASVVTSAAAVVIVGVGGAGDTEHARDEADGCRPVGGDPARCDARTTGAAAGSGCCCSSGRCSPRCPSNARRGCSRSASPRWCSHSKRTARPASQIQGSGRAVRRREGGTLNTSTLVNLATVSVAPRYFTLNLCVPFFRPLRLMVTLPPTRGTLLLIAFEPS